MTYVHEDCGFKTWDRFQFCPKCKARVEPEDWVEQEG